MHYVHGEGRWGSWESAFDDGRLARWPALERLRQHEKQHLVVAAGQLHEAEAGRGEGQSGHSIRGGRDRAQRQGQEIEVRHIAELLSGDMDTSPIGEGR